MGIKNSFVKKGTREMKYKLLMLLFILFGCNAKTVKTICRDGSVYYQVDDSDTIYIKGTSECIDTIKDEQ